ncbi:Rpe Pentose-5-phosphate-3-epimerase [Candidatus Nanopelagicaceae bacterium]
MSGHIRITPSILNADFSHLDEEIAKIAAVSDFIHLDVMDNVFVPNFTFDFAAASKIIASSPIPIDAHLMVADVDQIAIQYAEAGAASVTIHAEATSNISATLKGIRANGARSALAVKPATPIESYSECIDDVDMFLIMTVEPGFGGQKFMDYMMEKVRITKKIIGSRPIWLQVDGGISLETIDIAVEAGADTFVAGSAVFKAEDPAAMVIALRERALSSKLQP